MARNDRERRRSWAWWALTGLASSLLVSLLVGWILVWARFDEGPRAVMISLGSVAFTLVLVVLALLRVRFQRERRLRLAEARFLTGASHNLRTPLAGILVAAQALARGGLPEPDRRSLQGVVLREARLLALRVDNLIETGRLEIEGDAPLVESLELARVVDSALRGARDRIEHRGGRLETRLDRTVGVRGDERMLRLAIENLIDNAIRFSPAAPSVDVEVALDDRHAIVRVVDRGAGFDPAHPPDRTERLRADDRSPGGLGLGLDLARTIVRSHRGELDLASDGPGLGATATIRLPIAKED